RLEQRLAVVEVAPRGERLERRDLLGGQPGEGDGTGGIRLGHGGEHSRSVWREGNDRPTTAIFAPARTSVPRDAWGAQRSPPPEHRELPRNAREERRHV